jgi:hypothetical protein
MTVGTISRWPGAVAFDIEGMISGAEPPHGQAFRKALGPMGVRFS